jgi:hypothetical protein
VARAQALTAQAATAGRQDRRGRTRPLDRGSFEAFDLLYTGRGLSTDETARILIENTERAICR